MARLAAACLAALFLTSASGAALAQQSETVKGLLAEGFTVVGTIPSPIGPGVFLQKKDKLFLCFVAEAEKSPTVATRYCKPVE